MPHVSKIKVDPKLLEKLSKKFLNVISSAERKQSLPNVFKELFTDTEKIMLAKRLAIVLMLSDNFPQHRIVDLLKVSPTTVAKFSLKLEIGKYKNILSISKKEKVDLLKIVSDILTLEGIFPPIAGKGRWRFLKNIK